MKLFWLSLLLLTSLAAAANDHPDCAAPESWASSMALVYLTNTGVTSHDQVEHAKTQTVLMASELIGLDLHRQVHHVAFTEVSGKTIEAITRNDASSEECSMSDVEVFVVSQRLGGYP